MLLFAFNVSEVQQLSRQSDVFTFVVVSADDSSNFVKSCNFIFSDESINIVFNEAGVVISSSEDRVFKDSFEEFQIVFESNNFVVFKSSLHFVNGFFSGWSVSDEFGNHGIIKGGNSVVLSDSGLNSYTIGLFGFFEILELAVVGKEVIKRVFRVNSDLDCVAFFLNLVLFLGKRESTCHQQLPLHEVKPRNHF